jgi:hypothetical protein
MRNNYWYLVSGIVYIDPLLNIYYKNPGDTRIFYFQLKNNGNVSYF